MHLIKYVQIIHFSLLYRNCFRYKEAIIEFNNFLYISENFSRITGYFIDIIAFLCYPSSK